MVSSPFTDRAQLSQQSENSALNAALRAVALVLANRQPRARPPTRRQPSRALMHVPSVLIGLIATVLPSFVAVPGQAQAPAEFYKGKTIEISVGFSAGGAYDVYARMLARHIGRHIPGNPTV